MFTFFPYVLKFNRYLHLHDGTVNNDGNGEVILINLTMRKQC